ncbi:MAG: MarR family transcriptional regulator [Pseudomonadota bacterium]
MTLAPRRTQSVDPAGEFLADVPEYFFHILFQAQRRRELAFDTILKPLGLTLTTWRALLMVSRMEPCTMNGLARMSIVERTTLTRAIDHLVENGLVERSTPPEDRRQVRLCLTAKGAETYDAAMTVMMPLNRMSVAGLNEEQLRQMSRGLATVVDNLVDDPELSRSIVTFSNPENPGQRGEEPS